MNAEKQVKRKKEPIMFLIKTLVINVVLIITSFIAYGVTYDIPFDYMTPAMHFIQLYGLLYIPLCIVLVLQILCIAAMTIVLLFKTARRKNQ